MIRTILSCILLAALAAGGFGADAPSDEAVWNGFLSWYKTYTGPPYPGDLIKNYAACLASSGKSEGEVRLALETVKRVGASRSNEMMVMHFNRVYTIHQNLFSHEPNGLMVATVKGLKPGKALDVGMGQGRNAVFLAMQGWDVTGCDFSDEALARTAENAAKAGVKVRGVKSTYDSFDFGKEQWDLVVMTYSLVNMDDAGLLGRIKDSVKRGGLILVENPLSGGEGKGPANALFKTFQDLRVVHYEDLVAVAEWSLKPHRVGRLVAQKD